jgi:thiol:disulfide interchange protein DsbD
MRGLFGLFERRGISLSSLELAGVEARSMRKEGAVDRADEVELRMDAGQKMQLRYTVHGAVEIGGLWYFSGRPDTSVKVVENGQNQVVNLLRNQKRKPGPRAGRSRAERRPRRRNARRRGSGRRRGLRWHDSIRKALMEARRRRVPVVVDAYADWCGWCKKMEEETFTNPRVKQQLRRFALCKLDTEKYPNVTEKYNISGLPTTLVLRPDGQVMERKSGYMGPQKYMSFLRDAAGGSR